MRQRLILCLDGTWNTPDTERPEHEQVETNVRRLYESISTAATDGCRQVSWYIPGVGTKWYERIRGGVFGHGLSENILLGYELLSTHYHEGDEIYLFGFSRGAYTARSLVGLIRNCGLLWNPQRSLLEQAYALYRQRDASADTPEAQTFRTAHSRTARITFLGVWDTVGALGIPLQAFRVLNDTRYGFHNMELSSIVEHAYHAVALDEHRREYDATLWSPKARPHQVMEQRWFIGAHCDVGGGYADRRLSDISLRWMQRKARACGLAIGTHKVPQVTDAHCLGPVTDSYRAFLNGWFERVKTWKGEGRHFRAVCQTVYGNEIIDESARRRFRTDPQYRPQNPGFSNHIGLPRPARTHGEGLDKAA